MSHCRIGKVRMKSGGAEIRLMRRGLPDPNGENWQGKIVEHARMCAGHSTDAAPLVGFVVLALFGDGSHSVGHRYDPDRSPIPRRLLPAYVEEILREEIVTSQAVKEALE